jgi:hypothetical protein
MTAPTCKAVQRFGSRSRVMRMRAFVPSRLGRVVPVEGPQELGHAPSLDEANAAFRAEYFGLEDKVDA